MTQFIGAIDQGTTSTRFIVFNRDGEILSAAQKEHAQVYPRPGWVEHDPVEIWRNTQTVISECLSKAAFHAGDLAAIGITNQRETTVVWDRRTGAPLHNALVWQDTRTEGLVSEYSRDGGKDRFRAQTGLPLASYFSALKLRWLLDQLPGLRAAAARGEVLFGTIDAWLLWNLTGGPAHGAHLTDVTNASRTQLMNLRTLDWDDGLLAAFDIPRSVLPRIVASSACYAEAASAVIKGVKIAGMLGDQQAALVGQACLRAGEVKNTYGTGCFLLLNTGENLIPSTAGLISTVAYQMGTGPVHYALEGSIAITGALVQWLRDNLRIIASSAEIESMAACVSDNGDVYFVPAFSGLYAPHWKETARGTIVGLTRFATREHIARAALEATAYQTREVLEAMQIDAGIPIDALRVDGGMTANNLLMQFQSDILNVPVIRPKVAETTALGAAYAAGLAVGYWDDGEDIIANWREDKRWNPAMSEAQRTRLYRRWRRAVTRSFDWLESDHAAGG